MSNCLFPWCMPKSLEFLVEDANANANTNPNVNDDDDDNHRRRSIKNNNRKLLKVDGDGVLQVPTYRRLRREHSKLLSSCWDQDWDKVLRRCQSHPEEASHLTSHSGRTALHLATFNHPCPLHVAQALLRANRHMVLVQDANWYTPLHNVAFFPGEALVKVVCDTAIMVEQELQGRRQQRRKNSMDIKINIPPTSGMSPLFLAAKRSAPLRTLRQLLETRVQQQRTEWIAPSTGGEPYWMVTLDEYSSPLEVLLRDRAIKTWDLHKKSNQEEEGEDPIVSTLKYTSTSTSTLHPQTSRILTPRLLWQMKKTANERFRVSRATCGTGGESTDMAENRYSDTVAADDTQIPALDDRDEVTTEEEMQALSLWNKCVELLNEHIPRLLVQSKDDHDNATTALSNAENCFAKDTFAVVHCIASAKVPLPNLLQVALMVFPEQALLRDEYGMLPLHHVLSAKHPYATKTLVSMLVHHSPAAALYRCPHPHHLTTATATTTVGTEDDSCSYSPCSSTNTKTNADFTAMTTPLGLALEQGLSLDILKELLWADSDGTLTTIDPTTGLYPFAAAASKGYELGVVYTLLNAHPQVLNNHPIKMKRK